MDKEHKMRTQALAFSVCAIILSGCVGIRQSGDSFSHFDKYTAKFSTPEQDIPNVCADFRGGDYNFLNPDWPMYKKLHQTGLRKDTFGSITAITNGFSYKNDLTLIGSDFIDPNFHYIAKLNSASYKINQLCGIREGLERGRLDPNFTGAVLHINTDSPFSNGPIWSQTSFGDGPSWSLATFHHPLAKYNSSVVLYDDRNDAIMATIDISRHKDEPLEMAIQRLFLEVTTQAKSEISRVNKEYFEKQIPIVPTKPALPSVTKLERTTFETSEVFASRVEAVRTEEEKTREKAATDYIKKMQDRNQQIVELEEKYITATKAQAKENQRIADWLYKNQVSIMSYLAQNIVSTYIVENYVNTNNYNADARRLVVLVNYHNGTSKAVITASPDIAKKITLAYKPRNYGYDFGEVKIDTTINGELVLGKTYVRQDGVDWLELQEYTSSSADSGRIEVVIQHEPIPIPDINAVFSNFKAKVPTVDTVWQSSASIVVADLYNPKIPDWFMKPELSGNIGYGAGPTLDDAKNDALRELALKKNLSVSVEQSTVTKSFGRNLTEETLKKSVNVQTTKPYKDNFKIIRQEQSDGRWYVILQGV